MATTIGISSGPIEAHRTVQNDTKAQGILNRYSEFMGYTGTPKEKMQQIVDGFVEQMQQGAATVQYNAEAQAVRDDAINDSTFTDEVGK